MIKNLSLTLLLLTGTLFGQPLQAREVIDINQDWQFSSSDLLGRAYSETVQLPHSWNGAETWDESLQRLVGVEYSRGIGHYKKTLFIPEKLRGKRLFLKFGAANYVADVSINGHHLGQHRGGYSAFIFEISEQVRFGQDNRIEVLVDNREAPDIAPLMGDFNFYGGLIRPAQLLVTEQASISPLHFASSGVYLLQKQVSSESASVDIKIQLSSLLQTTNMQLKTRVLDHSGKTVASQQNDFNLTQGDSQASQSLTIEQPHLWQGKSDPYLYQVRVQLYNNGELQDEVVEPLGLRSYRVDAAEGLFLNEQPLKIQGVALHEDWPGHGPALTLEQRQQDVDIALDMGANGLRLAHYPHAKSTLELADQAGLVVWSEIPWVGLPVKGVDSRSNAPGFHDNLKQQLLEMIHQRYNHPSILFWGLYNELPAEDYPLLLELQQLAKQSDPGRLTIAASAVHDVEHPMHKVTDVQFWNRYFGWYRDGVDDLGPWTDDTRALRPDSPFGISEYGAGGSPRQHSEGIERPYSMGDTHHPESYQAYLHEHNWRSIEARPYVIGSFIWAMFDFSSSIRREGESFGLNDKGLVSYDRKIRKDAFYFYKANWSHEPFVYLTDHRNIYRTAKQVTIKAYSNLEQVELLVNGESRGTRRGEQGVFEWEAVPLVDDNNSIQVVASRDGQAFEHTAVWNHSILQPMMYALSILIAEAITIAVVGALLLLFFYLRAYRMAGSRYGTLLAKLGLYAGGTSWLLLVLGSMTLKLVF